MIPIRDTVQARSYPLVNTAVIAVNVLIYFVEMAQGGNLDRFLITYGLVPARYTVPEIRTHFTLFEQGFSFLSFMFLHGGFLHLLGNMWSLYIFGDNVEDRLGHSRYIVFYILCGVASGLSHLVLNHHSQVPTIGASGAIAGVMGAYFVLYPRARILTLIPIFFIPYFIEIPAFFFLGIWFLIQFMSAAGSQGQVGGVAWWAHVGGFVFGIIFLKYLMQGRSDKESASRTDWPQRKSHYLQVIKTTGSEDTPHLYGRLRLTPGEAQRGTRKMVNIPWGSQRRLFNVNVPPGVRDGTVLRLSGMGRKGLNGEAGDLYLRIEVGSEV
jgi:hypothetical protein